MKRRRAENPFVVASFLQWNCTRSREPESIVLENKDTFGHGCKVVASGPEERKRETKKQCL